MDQQRMREIAIAYMDKGEQLKLDAGYGGEMGDRGGGAMVREGKAFIAGLDDRLPESLKAFAKEIETKDAAERSEYERLKAKFEK